MEDYLNKGVDQPIIGAKASEGYVDADGRLILPPEVAARWGLTAGARVVLDEQTHGLQLARPVTNLAQIYIEPTSLCNLDCTTCIRNAWDEEMGQMNAATFGRILAAVKKMAASPAIFFGGFGEPLTHPHIIEMLQAIRPYASRLELITNGTLLNELRIHELLTSGLDTLWISIDGASPQSYEEVRLGAAYDQVMQNVENLHNLRGPSRAGEMEIGLAFVAMKSNLNDLAALLRQGRRLGITRFMVTNLLPYSPEMRTECLGELVLARSPGPRSPVAPLLDLPRMDLNPSTQPLLYQIFRSMNNLQIQGDAVDPSVNRCPFISKGAAMITWDGGLSPCMALMHNHRTYLYDQLRTIHRHIIGNVNQQELGDLWADQEYIAFRQRVQKFDFAPCVQCGGCDLLKNNDRDCNGNHFPTCGGCLWAQGVIQCP